MTVALRDLVSRREDVFGQAGDRVLVDPERGPGDPDRAEDGQPPLSSAEMCAGTSMSQMTSAVSSPYREPILGTGR
jgi:hypothetical protein